MEENIVHFVRDFMAFVEVLFRSICILLADGKSLKKNNKKIKYFNDSEDDNVLILFQISSRRTWRLQHLSIKSAEN